MAAIANVKVIESTIEVPVAASDQYRKVDREAKVGDVIRYDDDNDYLTRGGYYEVVEIDWGGGPVIIDNDGDEYDLCGDDYEVYEKVTAVETKEQETDELFTYGGVQYRKVKRKAAVGERILIVNAGTTIGKYENGDVHLITGKFLDYPTFNVVGGSIYANHTEYVVLEPVKSAEPPKPATPPARIPVGSYVRILVDTEGLPKGAIAKVTDDDGTESWAYHCELLDGSDSDLYDPEQLEVLSEAEAKAAVEAEAERAKWAAIGRKVNEYKAGDVVRCVGSAKAGYGEVLEEINGRYRVKYSNPTFDICTETVEIIALITPVEQRFDRTEAVGASS